MTHRKRFLLTGVISLVVVGLLPSAALAANVVKSTNNNKFRPASISILVGQRVRWKNPSIRDHTVTATSVNWSKDSDLNSGGTTAFRFNQTGTFTYMCTIHANMTGMVIVS